MSHSRGVSLVNDVILRVGLDQNIRTQTSSESSRGGSALWTHTNKKVSEDAVFT